MLYGHLYFLGLLKMVWRGHQGNSWTWALGLTHFSCIVLLVVLPAWDLFCLAAFASIVLALCHAQIIGPSTQTNHPIHQTAMDLHIKVNPAPEYKKERHDILNYNPKSKQKSPSPAISTGHPYRHPNPKCYICVASKSSTHFGFEVISQPHSHQYLPLVVL